MYKRQPVNYTVGQIRRYTDGKLYQCLPAHTSQAAWTPFSYTHLRKIMRVRRRPGRWSRLPVQSALIRVPPACRDLRSRSGRRFHRHTAVFQQAGETFN